MKKYPRQDNKLEASAEVRRQVNLRPLFRRGHHLPISDPACNILPPPPHTARRNYLPCKRWTSVKSVKSQSIHICSFGCSEGEALALMSSLPLERDSELRAFYNNAPFTS
ncbi:hypothetical protein TNCV_2171531 [Trichonephila clavipes]|nr:hypothetical protein TNCV_2171531 [Trichonephila clavipes]